jgi:fused signal recognition particle receptor
MAAADTFRAAAIEQLTEWSNRDGVEIIAQQEGSDPGAVVFDAIQAAKARKADIIRSRESYRRCRLYYGSSE